MSRPAPASLPTAPAAAPRAALPVSVVIPVYNGAAFLREALDSVAGQTRPPAEVIVVDNGSTDGSAGIARAAGATVLSLDRPNLSGARNVGIRAATQPWIAFLDADDLWASEKLALQWAAVGCSPDLGLVITDFTEFNGTGVLLPSFLARAANYHAIRRLGIAPGVVRCDGDSFRQHFLRGNFIAPSAALASRRLLMQAGLFDEGLTHLEDRDMWLRLIRGCVVAVVERPVVHTRIHAANWSGDRLKMALGCALLAERVLAHPERYPGGAPDYYRLERPKYYLNAGRFAEDRDEVGRARRYYARAWRAGGGLRPFVLAALCFVPGPVRRAARMAARRLHSAPRETGS